MRSLAVRVVGGAVVLGLVVSLAVTATAQKRGGTLTIVRPTDPVSLDPNLETTAPGAWVYFNMLEGLLTLDEKMQVKPALATLVASADLVIGAVLVPGAAAPKLVSRDMLRTMHRGAVLVDVAIDQGGCFETSRPTTHADPTFVVDGVVHYCVANMPGAVARTSTFALNNATLPFVLALADKGTVGALRADPHLRAGLNVYEGKITHPAVAEALGLPYFDLVRALGV